MIGIPVRRGRWADHPYIAVGGGPRTLLVIPGLNDPLCRVTDRWWFSLLVATYCSRYTGRHTVAMVSRPPGVAENATTRELAAGYANVLKETGPADVMGLSMGGFLLAHLAADHPENVEHAVFGLAADRLGARGRAVVERWCEHARGGEFRPIYAEAADAVTSGLRGPIVRGAAGLYGRLATPSPDDRRDFLVSAEACLAHDASDRLDGIDVPTLVIGGTDDPFFSAERYRETAAGIPHAHLVEIPEAGHEAVLDRRREFDGAIRDLLYE
ncbi:alpha/beta fold hydrolase [Halalkalicoccus subterraneus]|uniref:alpha/beta fold hydrolase n=1 Tax=Halalkalicoccus subterraneus TaxID=2675002 RepID=UPI000EFBBFEE|nr:alpha/beta fold hydrolase [Halalkalicoccus subterraneus]